VNEKLSAVDSAPVLALQAQLWLITRKWLSLFQAGARHPR